MTTTRRMDKHVYGQSMDTSVGKDLQKFHTPQYEASSVTLWVQVTCLQGMMQ